MRARASYDKSLSQGEPPTSARRREDKESYQISGHMQIEARPHLRDETSKRCVIMQLRYC